MKKDGKKLSAAGNHAMGTIISGTGTFDQGEKREGHKRKEESERMVY